MSKTKRLLSVTLAIAMIILSAFSAFADGTETVVETVGAMIVAADSIETDDTTFDVNVKISFNKYVTGPHNIITLTCNNFNLTNVELGDVVYNYTSSEGVNGETVQLPQGKVTIAEDGVKNANWATGKVLIEAPVDGTAPLVSEINLTATFTLKTDVDLVAGETLNIAVANDDMADASETKLSISSGASVVTVHGAGTTYGYDEKNHWHACVVEGCTEHTYDVAAHTMSDYVANEDGTTETATCTANCGYSVSKDIVVDTTLDIAFSAKTLSLKSAIAINYFVTATDFDGYDEFYVDIVQYLADGTTRTEKLEGTYVYTSGVGYEYQFDYTGIAAKEMNDRVYATICAVKDGVTYSSVPEEYGVYTYAYGRLEKSSNAKLKTTLVDMLNYGAAAQLYLNYNKENLANAALTDEQKALGTTTVPEMTNYRNLGSTSDTLTVEHTSPALSLKSSVGITYYSKLTSYTGDKNNLSLVFTYADDMDPVVVPFSEMEAEGSEYKYAFYNVTARQMRNVCTFVWYENYGTDNQVAVSDTMTYSIESYAQSKYLGSNELLSNVVLEMMRYSDSAKAYLG